MTTYTDLDNIDNSSGFTAGCDLGGNSTCQTVIGLQGNPISNTAPTLGYFLKWDGTQWIPASIPTGNFVAGGDLSGTETNQTVIRLNTYPIASTAPSNDQVLLWDNSDGRWEPTTLTFIGGDLSGTYPSPTVVKLRGKDLDADLATIGADQDGYKLTWINASNEWQATPASSTIIWNSDLFGSEDTNQYVTRISGDLDSPDFIVTLGRNTNSKLQLIGEKAANAFTGDTGIPITILGSEGGDGTSSTGGNGGILTIKAGKGGTGGGPTKEGGTGGDLNISGGDGGDGGSGAAIIMSGGDLNLSGGQPSAIGTGGAGVQGDVNITGTNINLTGTNINLTGFSTGIVHSTSGTLSSSLIVNADVDSSAAIVVSKLAAGTANQVLINNATPTPTWTTLSGDVTNVLGVMTVGAINGATVPVAGALTTGNVLQVSGASTLSYGPVNLAGGSNYVTGTLPVGNLPTLAGDVTGSITSNTVEKINSTSVPDGPNANEVLVAISDSAAIWSQIYDGYVASNANIAVSKLAPGTAGQLLLNNAGPTPTWTTMSGDATISSAGAVNVAKINGTTITTAGGSLATGAVLRVTGVATADWGQLDLADTDAVTGVLPKANQAAQDMAGDVSGTTAASVVDKLKTKSLASALSTIGADQDGYVLTWVNGSTEWQAKPGGSGSGVTTVGTFDSQASAANGLVISGTTLYAQSATASNPGMLKLTRDLGNTAASPQVVGLYGKNLASALASVGSTEDGYQLTWVNASSEWQAKPNMGDLKVSPEVTVNYSIASTDQVVRVGTLTSSITLTLPTSPNTGKVLRIKNGNNMQFVRNAAGSITSVGYTVTVTPASGNIDGLSSFVMNQPYMSLTLCYNGSEWMIV